MNMDIVRIRASDGTLEKFDADWAEQCKQIDDDLESYGIATMPMIRSFAEAEADKEWAIAIKDGERFLAAACAIRTMQKPHSGWVLRIREVTVCPLLDYGNLDENSYIDTLIAILNGALKLSESELMANHIKLHLRSPSDAVFFRAFGNTLDSKGIFAATEAHGAWLTISKKAPPLQPVK
jgi:hypothetical protein